MPKLNHFIGVFPGHREADEYLERHGSKEVGILYRHVDGTIYMCDGQGWFSLMGGLESMLLAAARALGDVVADRVSEAVAARLDAVVVKDVSINAVTEEVLATQRAFIEKLDNLQLTVQAVQAAPEEPEYLLPIDDSIADVDTAGESEIEAAPEAEELVLTEDVVDKDLAGELARLRELKTTKEGGDDE